MTRSRRLPSHVPPIKIVGALGYVPLTHGFTAVIDAEDAPLVAGYNWSAGIARNKYGEVRYVCGASTRHPAYLLHRAIGGPDTELIDGDGLNCRRSNLRRKIARLDPRGVHFMKATGKYAARIVIKGKVQKLGVFDTPAEASAAYEAARLARKRRAD